MSTMEAMVEEFLAQKRIAVAGVSRGSDKAANSIYRKFKNSNYEVFALNPHTDQIDDIPCYPDLQSISGGVDGVVIVTSPEATDQIVKEAAEMGISRVWMHRSLMGNSVSESAVSFCRENGISVIAGGCPNMYCNADFGHRCMKWIGKRTGAVPK